MNIEGFLGLYEYFNEPKTIRTVLSTDEQFIWWLRLGDIKGTEKTLERFEKEEMFEDCVLIKKVLNEKRREYLESIGMLNGYVL